VLAEAIKGVTMQRVLRFRKPTYMRPFSTGEAQAYLLAKLLKKLKRHTPQVAFRKAEIIGGFLSRHHVYYFESYPGSYYRVVAETGEIRNSWK